MACRLRRLKRDDLEMVMHWRMLPEITQFMYSDPILTVEAQHIWFDRVSQSKHECVWIIELADSGLAVGLLSLSEIEHVHMRCSWAYYIAESAARNKGLSRSLELNIYAYVFDKLGMNKICCEVFSSNHRVVTLHERFGAKVEGILRQHIWKNGEFLDVVQMAILKSDWQTVSNAIQFTPIFIE